MGVTITEKAAQEFKRFQEKEDLGENAIVRVAIQSGGCSGFMYDLSFDVESSINSKDDTVAEIHDITLVVDKKSMLYLDGTVVDYYSDLNQQGFIFKNPNETNSCGCGKSAQF